MLKAVRDKCTIREHENAYRGKKGICYKFA
jgi:hypothetical protein